MAGESGSESAIVAAVAEVAQDAIDHAAVSEAIADSVIENAQERIDEAQETAQRIAEAAMQTEVGRRVGDLEHRVNYEWPELHAELSRQLETLTSQVSDIQASLAATATLTVAQAISSPSIQPLSPGPEAITEAITEVQEILPEAMGQSVVVDAPEVLPKVSKRRWM